MPMTVAPTSASARTKCRWVGGNAGSTKTMFTWPPRVPLGVPVHAPCCAHGSLADARSRRHASRTRYGHRVVVAAFVAPFLLEATTRFVATAAQVPGVRLAVITSTPAEQLPPVLKEHLDGHWRVDDALDPRQIAEAVAGLSRQMGRVERLIGALEQLQVPLAQVREALGIEGMDVQTARNVRDKARMKTVLREAGVPCARHQLVSSAHEALGFAEAVGFPLVAKPPAGAGALATYRLD